MHINNLGGARLPVTTTAGSTTQTARTSFGSLVQGSAAASTAGRAGLTGSSVIASAISSNSGGAQGFGAPYLQAMSSGVPGVGGNASTPTQGQAPATGVGSEFNGELAAMSEQQEGQKAMKELIKMSLISFVNSTFAMGQNRPKADDW
ncbi:hypothetical protein [Hyalangium sp.]|uniref:hypothetical protein n=1 Tax=Hyalangium sp. TaxID=2028555 RepID=UPI002D32EEAF|nr:hypothetical protein [Hyalangium sp.]HYI02631.1 hypothetical protein [Hyalangium sp.]